MVSCRKHMENDPARPWSDQVKILYNTIYRLHVILSLYRLYRLCSYHLWPDIKWSWEITRITTSRTLTHGENVALPTRVLFSTKLLYAHTLYYFVCLWLLPITIFLFTSSPYLLQKYSSYSASRLITPHVLIYRQGFIIISFKSILDSVPNWSGGIAMGFVTPGFYQIWQWRGICDHRCLNLWWWGCIHWCFNFR